MKNLKPPRKRKEWLKVGRKTIKHYDKWVWRWTGHELMKRVRKWAEKYPTVRICGCDDDHFCNSDLVIIPHERKRYYMGATVVFIPQCTGEQPIKFFLYPDHANRLIPALLELQRKAISKKKPT
jgi:hypothetical protein